MSVNPDVMGFIFLNLKPFYKRKEYYYFYSIPGQLDINLATEISCSNNSECSAENELKLTIRC